MPISALWSDNHLIRTGRNSEPNPEGAVFIHRRRQVQRRQRNRLIPRSLRVVIRCSVEDPFSNGVIRDLFAAAVAKNKNCQWRRSAGSRWLHRMRLRAIKNGLLIGFIGNRIFVAAYPHIPAAAQLNQQRLYRPGILWRGWSTRRLCRQLNYNYRRRQRWIFSGIVGKQRIPVQRPQRIPTPSAIVSAMSPKPSAKVSASETPLRHSRSANERQ
jgi:hypothetical protein